MLWPLRIYDLCITYLLKPWTSSHKKLHINKNPKTTTFPSLSCIYCNSANKEPQKNNDKHLRTLSATKDTPKNKQKTKQTKQKQTKQPPHKKTNKQAKQPPRKNKKQKQNKQTNKQTNKQNKGQTELLTSFFQSGILLKTCQLQVSGSDPTVAQASPSVVGRCGSSRNTKRGVVFAAPKAAPWFMIPMMAEFLHLILFCWLWPPQKYRRLHHVDLHFFAASGGVAFHL